jgi:hypothetical protein
MPNYRSFTAPKGLGGTVLRGELYGEDVRSGRAIPAGRTGGLLNAGVWESREKQRREGVELKPVIFDVVRYRGRDVEKAPYSKKLEILREVSRRVPRLKMPPTASSPEDKASLFSRIQAGKEPITDEGIVVWHKNDHRPTKAKFRPDVDAEVVGVTEGRGKHEGRVGALQVRISGRGGITNVGTGLSDKLREEIAKDPDAYVGRVAKIRTLKVFENGKMRAPSFGGFHIEKGKQEMKQKTANILGALSSLVARRAAKHPVRTALMAYGTDRRTRKSMRLHALRMRALEGNYPAGWASLGMFPKRASAHVESVRRMTNGF